MDLDLSVGSVKTKCFDKRDEFDFDIVNFPFLDGDDLVRHPISQFIRFARLSI